MPKTSLVPARHGPPFVIEAIPAYEPGAFPSKVLGYQLCVMDSLDHIIHTMKDKKIYPSQKEALADLGETPLMFKKKGFDYGGGPLPEFMAWCEYYFVPLPEPPEPAHDVTEEDIQEYV